MCISLNIKESNIKQYLHFPILIGIREEFVNSTLKIAMLTIWEHFKIIQ